MSYAVNVPAPAHRLKTLITFLRFEYLSVAVIFPFAGAATTGVALTGFRVLGILAGAFAYHIYVSLLNDIIDLPLDRTNPARAVYPLVSGRISRGAALAITLIQLPIAAAIIYWQSGSPAAYAAMALALGMMTIYNVWGKRSPFPPAIDLIQGIGFAALGLYGAALTGSLTRLSWVGFGVVVVWMVLINFLGGLRDLHSDLTFGVKTTPIFFGVRPAGKGEFLPPCSRYYAYALQVVLISGGSLMIAWNDLHYLVWQSIVLAILCCAGGALALFLLITMFGVAARDYDTMLVVGFRFIGICGASLVLTLLPAWPWWAAVGVIGVFLLTYHDYSPEPILAYWRER
jgi:4-hydroxybenzoate polyprenyltransferase